MTVKPGFVLIIVLVKIAVVGTMFIRYKKKPKLINVLIVILVVFLFYQLHGLLTPNGYLLQIPTGDTTWLEQIHIEQAYINASEEKLKIIERSLLCHSCRLFNREHHKAFRYKLRSMEPNSSADLLVMAQDNVYFNESLRYYLAKGPKYYIVNKKLINVLPEKSPFVRKHFKRCSVVGNSGVLKNSDCGSEIDKSDYIFRCNMAPIKPFGNDAGYRTHFTTMNPSILKNRYNTFDRQKNISDFREDTSKYNGLIWIPGFGDNYWIKTCFRAFYHHRTTNSKLVFGHPEHFKAIWRFWEKHGLQTWPSTGFYLATAALDLCDEVHLFGFWPFNKQYYPQTHDVNYHYYEHLPWAKKHNMTSEFQLLWQLHMDGVLKIHTGKCNET